ncbi:MBOAT-domain-containing protein [Ramicandelaber brevisporus]|nr:MBOAT-domain-containing protein [Ramicandelaber brevisporus]
MSVGKTQLVVSMLASFASGQLTHSLKSAPAGVRHAAIIASTALISCYICGHVSGFIQIVTLSHFMYYFIVNVKHKFMPSLVMVMCMMWISYHHWSRMKHDAQADERMDYTAPMMMMVQKLTSFAYNVADGRHISQQIDDHEYQVEHAVDDSHYPGLLEFFGYVLFTPGFLVGPSIPFAKYRKLMNGTLYSNMQQQQQQQQQPVGRIRAALLMLARAVTCMTIFATISLKLNQQDMLTPWYTSLPLHRRLLHQWFCGLLHWMGFYLVWSLAEGGCILANLGFTGVERKTKKPIWEGVAVVRIYGVTFASNMRDLFVHWNIPTNTWLRYYVYERMSRSSSPSSSALSSSTTTTNAKPRQSINALIATFMVSAAWHGFYPGYYLSFGSFALAIWCMRLSRRYIRPLTVPSIPAAQPLYSKKWYDIIGTFITSFASTIFASAFLLLTWSDSIYLWRVNYFLVHLCCLATIAWLTVVGGARKCRKLQQDRVESISRAFLKFFPV